MWIDIGAVDRIVAARTVASAPLQVNGVVLFADVYPTRPSLHLGMALEAEI